MMSKRKADLFKNGKSLIRKRMKTQIIENKSPINANFDHYLKISLFDLKFGEVS